MWRCNVLTNLEVDQELVGEAFMHVGVRTKVRG